MNKDGTWAFDRGAEVVSLSRPYCYSKTLFCTTREFHEERNAEVKVSPVIIVDAK